MKRIITWTFFSFIAFICYGQGVWTPKADCLGSARYRAFAFEINGKCYMGTGSTGGGISQNLKDLWEYDVASNTWSQKADLAGPNRTNGTATSANGFGYAGLGTDNGTMLKDWYQYDPVANTWQSKASLPGNPRFGAGSFSIQNMIYAGGGLDSLGNPKTDFYMYDPGTDTWTQKSSLLTGVACMAVFTIGEKGYFVAGLINGSVSSVRKTAEYDVVTDTWTYKADYPPGNTFSAIGFAIDGHGYVGTGFTGSLTDVMYRYDPIGDVWTQETSWPTGIRQWAVSCVSGNRAFVGTGNSTGGQLFNDWWEFTSIFTATHELNRNSEFHAGFNASSGEITLKNSSASGLIFIYDVEGKLIFRTEMNSTLKHIPWTHKGIYYVSLVDGKNSSVSKLACIF